MKHLPSKPNLEHLKAEAKSLLAAYRKGDRSVFDGHPSPPEPSEAKLADAQFGLARSYGFASWARLKLAVETSDASIAQMAEAFVLAAIRRDGAKARALLDQRPEITRVMEAALVAGDPSVLERLTPEVARAVGGPAAWPFIAYAAYSPFLRDAARGKTLVAIAERMLDLGADPNAPIPPEGDFNPVVQPYRPLYGACGVNNHVGMTSLLLERGADPDDDESLYHACEHRDHGCLKLLLEHGVRLRYSWKRILDFEDLEGARLMLEAGADLNGEHPPGMHHAVLRGRSPEYADLFDQFGADWMTRDQFGRTAYQLARIRGRQAWIEKLTEMGHAHALEPGEELLAALAIDDRESVDRLVRDDPGLVGILAPFQLEEIVKAAEDGRLETIRTMIEIGWPVNARDNSHAATALHWACIRGRVEMAELLLAAGANVEWEDRVYRCRPMCWLGHAALGSEIRDADAAQIARGLIEAGAPVDPGLTKRAKGEFGRVLQSAWGSGTS